ncbi:WSC domain-containing protein [Mycena maculata]|uniref:WSC domain-containing protein n=1 Tax=Mycena maculata TaxID=230809 RepID=A0AAD7MIB7_9AGAR|nr:WSC domain-containing protein [Mycena maculata]
MSVLSFSKMLLAPLLPLTVAATPSHLGVLPRQSNPTDLPGNWSLAGCYTDVSTARTLAATATAGPNMTVEACIAFCAAGDYIFAGVEFGDECYCDSTIQIPGVGAPITDCNEPCVGNPSEFCGASGFLTVFASGAPDPTLVADPELDWSYQGCLTDDVANRTLQARINVPVGVTAQTCTASCEAAGAYLFAGLEDGQECWCGNSTNTFAENVSDDDCREVCVADHTEYCGNADRIALYAFSPNGAPPPPQACAGDIANFTLLAIYNNPPQGFPPQVGLTVVLVELVPNTFWTILSACPTCCTDWPTLSIQNSVVFPRSLSNPVQSMASIGPADGESPAFVASSPPFAGDQAYCAAESSTATNAPPLLSFGGKDDSWALCTNISANANNRVDLVFSPVTNHPHYEFSSCNAVTIQMIQG